MAVLQDIFVGALLLLAPFVLFGVPPLLWSLYREHRARERDRRDWTKPDNLIRLVAIGIPTNQCDQYGDTPLHLAYYFGYQDTIDQLIDDGADETAANGEGLVPAQLVEVGRAARDLRLLAGSLDNNGEWKESVLSLTRFNAALGLPDEVYLPAQRRLLRRFIIRRDEFQYGVLAWKLGRLPVKELSTFLEFNFDRNLADYFLRCGSPLLAQTAKYEAERMGYRLMYTTARPRAPRGSY